mgnify:CR=1 FL=1
MNYELSDRAYLLRLISEGEHQQQDFKYRVEDAEKLARSVSAFANTDGGRLLIGVRDDGYLSGVRSEEEIYVMHQAAYRYCRPESTIKFDTYHVPVTVEGDLRSRSRSVMRTIVVATVPPSVRKPVYALEGLPAGTTANKLRSRAFIRIKDENIVASPVHLAIWREEQSPLGTSFTYGPDEQSLVATMQQTSWLRLNPLVRHSHLPRQKVILLLARLCRYGLARWRLSDHQFEFALA